MDSFRVKGNKRWQAYREEQSQTTCGIELSSALPELACGSKEFDSPFPFPPGGKPGRGWFPPRRKHAARQPKALASIDAAGSPHKRAAAPLRIPRERAVDCFNHARKTETVSSAKNRTFHFGLDMHPASLQLAHHYP
jgi:hypothetical protein